MVRSLTWMLLTSAAIAASPAAAATGDTARIIDEGMNRSQVMVTAHELMDDIGPRLTISTNMRRAQDWALAKFTSYGLVNVHREPFVFGRGWDIIDSNVQLVSPRPIKLTAIPIAWTPPTNGTISAPVIIAPMNRPEHFAAYRGQLRGKIVLVSLPDGGSESTDPVFHRLTGDEIAKEDKYQVPHFDPAEQNMFLKRIDFIRQMDQAYAAADIVVSRAGALAIAELCIVARPVIFVMSGGGP